MKKIILVNGLIAGAIVSAMMLIVHPFVENGTVDMGSGMLVGYTSMVVSLSVIFFGIKAYRDQYSGGYVTFGKALTIGLLISLIASLVYATTWQIYSYMVATDFMEIYIKTQIDDLRATGATEAEIDALRADLERQGELYNIPIIRFMMTLLEIMPVGLIIALIAAGILRKRDILPA